MGVASGAAGVLFGVSIGALAAFFVTRDERFDRVAEWSFVAFSVLAVVTILAVPRVLPDGGTPLAVLTAVGIAGAAAVGLGELGTALRAIDFRRVAPVVTAGFIAFLVWVGGVSLLALGSSAVPVALGWLGVVAIVVAIGIVVLIVRSPGVVGGEAEPDRRLMTAFFVPLAGVVAWLVWLGQSL